MTDTASVQTGDVAELTLILNGKYTVSKAAGVNRQNDIIANSLVTKNLVYLYYVDLGDGLLHQAETLQFNLSTSVLEKQVLMNLYNGSLRFQYSVFTTALRDAASSVTIYYKIFRVNVR